MEEEKLLSSYLEDLSRFLEINESTNKMLGKHLSEITESQHFSKLNIEFHTTDDGVVIKFAKIEK